MSYREISVATQEASLLKLAELAKRSAVHPAIRKAAKAITSSCDARDDVCELEAIYRAVKEGDDRVPGLSRGMRYVSDPARIDYFTSPLRTLEDCRDGACGGDCLPGETLLLGAGYKFVQIKDVNEGDTIMGDGKWVKVFRKLDKGVQETLSFNLSNGCTLTCTSSHKLFIICPGDLRDDAAEILAGDVRAGDVLLKPAQPFDAEFKPLTPFTESPTRVVAINEGPATETFDIEVEGHRFYLPESDVVVHNCDDHASLICALASSIGFRVGLRAYGKRGANKEYTHVYAVVALPKFGKVTRVFGMDTTVPSADAGWEPPKGHALTAWIDDTRKRD